VTEHNVLSDDEHWEQPAKMSRADEAALRERIGQASRGDYVFEQPIEEKGNGSVFHIEENKTKV
jgi:hypothetical protein